MLSAEKFIQSDKLKRRYICIDHFGIFILILHNSFESLIFFFHNIVFEVFVLIFRSKKVFMLSLVLIRTICEQEFVGVEVLRPSQPNGVMLSAVSLPNHMFTGQA